MHILFGDVSSVGSFVVSAVALGLSVIALRTARKDRSADYGAKVLSERAAAYSGYLPVLRHRQQRRAYYMSVFRNWDDETIDRLPPPADLSTSEADQATFAMDRVINGAVRFAYDDALAADANWEAQFRAQENRSSTSVAEIFRREMTPEEFKLVEEAARLADHADEELLRLMTETAELPDELPSGRRPAAPNARAFGRQRRRLM